MRNARSLVPAAIFFAAAAGFSCAKVLGIEQLPRGTPVDAGVDALPPWSFVAPSCDACLQSQCADESAACLADDDCHRLRGCLVQCAVDDVRCRSACESASPNAAASAIHRSLDACVRTACIDDCYGDAGVGALFGDACEACAKDNCAKEVRACIQSPTPSADATPIAGAGVGDCERFAACLGAQSTIDPDVSLHCYHAYAAGAAESRAFGVCLHQATCAGCPLSGTDLRCTGKYRWRGVVGSLDHYDFSYNVYPSGDPFPNLSVSSCDLASCASCDPTTHVTTDATGRVSIPIIAPTTNGWHGCFLSQGITPAGEPIFPALTVFGRPITSSEGLLSETQLTQSYILTLAAVLGADPHTTDYAQIAIFAADCAAQHASGISLEIEPNGAAAKIFYFPAEVPDATATATGGNGLAGFANVTPPPSGFVKITAKNASDGSIVSTQTSVPVRKGWITVLWLYPDPQP